MMIKYKDLELGTCEWVFVRGIVDYRIEDIMSFTKEMKSFKQVRKFEKDKSVFKDWEEDTPNSLRRCVDHDLNCWKIRDRKIVKPSEDLNNCEKVIEDHFELLKHISIFM